MNSDQPSREQVEARLTALLLGELPAEEAELLRWTISQDTELQKLHDQLKLTMGFVREAMKNPAGAPVERETPLKLSQERRQKLLAHFKTDRPQKAFWLRRIKVSPLIPALAAVAIIAVLAALLLPVLNTAKMRSQHTLSLEYNGSINDMQQLTAAKHERELETRMSANSASESTKRSVAANPPESEVPPPPTPIVLPNTESSQMASEQNAGTDVYSQSIVGYVNVTPGASSAKLSPAPAPASPEPNSAPIFARLQKPASTPTQLAIQIPQTTAGGSYTVAATGPLPTANGLARTPEGLSDSGGKKLAINGNGFYAENGAASVGWLGTVTTQFNADGGRNALSWPADHESRSVQVETNFLSSRIGNVGFADGSVAQSPFASRLQSALNYATNGAPDAAQWFDFPDQSSADQVTNVVTAGAGAAGQRVPGIDQSENEALVARANQNAKTVLENSDRMQAVTISGRQTEMRATAIQPNVTGFNFTAAPTNMRPPAGEPQQYEMKTLKVDPNTFYAGVQNVGSFTFGPINPTNSGGGNGQSQSGAVVPVVNNPLGDLSARAETGGGGLLYVTTPNQTRDVSALARQYFSSLGVKLDPPKTVFYNDRLGVLFVYATPQDLDTIGNAIQILNEARKNPADNETIPPGLIDFEGVDVSQVLEVYAQLVGRTLLRSGLPSGQIVLKNQTPLTRTEAIETLQKALALHGIAVINVGDKFVKALPVSQAGMTGEQTDKPLPAPMVPAPVPQPEILTSNNAFSTFSLNVSDVSFKLASASLGNGQMPAPASIRSEEFVNAFDYHDPEPLQGQPLAFAFERASDPFDQERDLLRFSIKAGALGRQGGRALNLVLLLDTSGSMERADRVTIIREALRVLSAQLQPQDTVSVVTFARTARLWADGVPGDQAGATLDKVGSITPEGGTNLEEAMRLAYETALRHFHAGGINRVVLLTDGAANLGNVDPEALTQKVEAERKQGIALDCFGIGWEDYNDDLLEQLSSNGDGRYAFINSPDEAGTEFAAKLAGALQVAAEDVKVQVEFNPNRVTAWRQVGYAKHQLTKEQFRDNSVAAGAIASREAGNALYVIETRADGEGPIATVRVRYRVPGTQDNHERSWLVDYTGAAPALVQSSPAMRLTATAAEFSEWLADSPFAQDVTPDELLNYLNGVPQSYGTDDRPKQLEWMIRQAKSVSGK